MTSLEHEFLIRLQVGSQSSRGFGMNSRPTGSASIAS